MSGPIELLRRMKAGAAVFWLNEIVNRLVGHRLRLRLYRAVGYNIAPGASIHRGVRFDAVGGFDIGTGSTINRGCRIDTRGGVSVGSCVSISEEVVVLTGDHDLRRTDFLGRARAVRLGDHCFVGTRAVLLPGISLGEGAAIGAASVVTKDVPAFEIWAGSPARKVGTRPRDLEYDTYYRPYLS